MVLGLAVSFWVGGGVHGPLAILLPSANATRSYRGLARYYPPVRGTCLLIWLELFVTPRRRPCRTR